jgi:Uma2 family endonuclease
MTMAVEKDRRYTYGDIENCPEDERWELIDGVPYLWAQPSPRHQNCVAELIVQFRTILKGKPCIALQEVSVWLDLKPGDNHQSSGHYVVPDLAIVCNKVKIQDDGIYGVPDLVIEVLSPSTAGMDLVKKYNQYLMVGLQEYWIVDPLNLFITIYTLKGDEYKAKNYDRESKVPVGIFNGQVEINAAEILPSSLLPL